MYEEMVECYKRLTPDDGSGILERASNGLKGHFKGLDVTLHVHIATLRCVTNEIGRAHV